MSLSNYIISLCYILCCRSLCPALLTQPYRNVMVSYNITINHFAMDDDTGPPLSHIPHVFHPLNISESLVQDILEFHTALSQKMKSLYVVLFKRRTTIICYFVINHSPLSFSPGRSCTEKPKSESLRCPWSSRRIFSGLRSRCTILRE